MKPPYPFLVPCEPVRGKSQSDSRPRLVFDCVAAALLVIGMILNEGAFAFIVAGGLLMAESARLWRDPR